MSDSERANWWEECDRWGGKVLAILREKYGKPFDEPTEGLMNRKPRPVSAPILSSQQWIRLTILGLLMAVGALIVRDRGEAEYDVVVGSTMLLTTLTFFHVFAGLSARDELGTIFSRASIPGWAQLRLYGESGRLGA